MFSLDWYHGLTAEGRRAFWAGFAGIVLAGFDFLSFTFVLATVRTEFGLSEGQAGWLATSSLLASAVGGVIGGALADSIGRVRTMMLTVAIFAIATFLCGLSQSYEQLLICRVLIGLGFGGEWTASNLLVAEYALPVSRGRLLGLLASAFTVGDAVAALAAVVVARLVPPDVSWRLLFWLGVLPALLLVWVRTRVVDSPVYLGSKRAHPSVPLGLGQRIAQAGRSLGEIFSRRFVVTTVAATLLASGALSGRYVVTVWLPTYLLTGFHLDAAATSAQMLPVLIGSWFGYLGGGYSQDRLGRRRTFALFAIASAAAIWLYVQLPGDAGVLLAVLGIPVGFCTSAVISGLGAYLAELFPTRIRGIGQGFSYSFGRAVAALPVALVGSLATVEGLGRAIVASVVVYVLCLIGLRFLPETRGKDLSDGG